MALEIILLASLISVIQEEKYLYLCYPGIQVMQDLITCSVRMSLSTDALKLSIKKSPAWQHCTIIMGQEQGSNPSSAMTRK